MSFLNSCPETVWLPRIASGNCIQSACRHFFLMLSTSRYELTNNWALRCCKLSFYLKQNTCYYCLTRPLLPTHINKQNTRKIKIEHFFFSLLLFCSTVPTYHCIKRPHIHYNWTSLEYSPSLTFIYLTNVLFIFLINEQCRKTISFIYN